jgi:glycosyltransferase involved in cell wall biosynthesis
MTISLLMLTYNSVQFIKRAINSVTEQSYEDWELIINDDCSTDGTAELACVLALKDKRIKIRQNPERLGIAKNRLAAFKRAASDLIGHVDGDDELYPYSLQTMVAAIKQHPEVDLFFSDVAWIDANSTIFQYNANTHTEGNLSDFGWRHLTIYRRSAYERTAGYNTALISGCEDGDLAMQIADTSKIMRVPHVLYKHRWHEYNASRKNKKCETCEERPVCNYIRVWGKHVSVDPITFTPLKKEQTNDAHP